MIPTIRLPESHEDPIMSTLWILIAFVLMTLRIGKFVKERAYWKKYPRC